MDEKFFHEVIHKAPFGYAYHKLIFHQNGEPEDYIFLDVNLAFEEMTGLKREIIIGKKVTEVIPDIRKGFFDWVNFYGNITPNQETLEFTQFEESLNSWYKISAFSLKEGYFITIFQEIDREMKRIEMLESQKNKINVLVKELEAIYNGTHDAMFLVELKDDGEVSFINNNLVHKQMIGNSISDNKDLESINVNGIKIKRYFRDKLEKCINSMESIAFEEKIDFSGSEKIFSTSLNPIVEGDKVKYIVGSSKDITFQRMVEVENENLLQLFKAMFNEHAAIMLLSEPFSGKIIDANPAASKFYGYTMEELLNINIQKINMLSDNEVEQISLSVLNQKQTHFILPHRLKSGDIRRGDSYSSQITHNGMKRIFSIIFDVTDREKYREELYEEKELLSTTFFSMVEGVIVIDKNENIKLMNRAAQKISGFSEERTKNKPFSEIFVFINDTTNKEIKNPIIETLSTEINTNYPDGISLITKDGNRIPLAINVSSLIDEYERNMGVLFVFHDISKEKKQQEKILYLSYHDSLTGLYNRRFMEEEMKRLDTKRQLPISIILGDLNGLKLTNDIFGHQAGDELLIKVANVLRESCRSEDIIARWGGDEFIILLSRTNLETAEMIIKRIRERCTYESSHRNPLSIALGCASKTDSSMSLEKVIKRADELMYKVKIEERKNIRKSIINTLKTTLYEKSNETAEKTSRIKHCCIKIGKELILPPTQLEVLSLLGELHNIGMVNISEEILKKKGPLTPEEWTEIKKHPEIGYRIAQNISEISVISEFILSHHEHWDGNGYPRGLKGEDIPLFSRILSVVDAYDTMTHERYYRKAISKKEALDIIKHNAGTQFDPEVVKVFVKLSC